MTVASLDRSRILKLEKFPEPDLDSKILEQEQSRSLKKCLRPPLAQTSPPEDEVTTGHGSGVPESTPEGFLVFLSDPDLDPGSSKISDLQLFVSYFPSQNKELSLAITFLVCFV